MVVETGGEEESVDGMSLVRAHVVEEKLERDCKRGEAGISHGNQANGLLVVHDRCGMPENVYQSPSKLRVCRDVLAV